MNKLAWSSGMVAVALLAPAAFAQQQNQTGQGQAVVTVLARQHGELAPKISQQDLSVKTNGKDSNVTGWVPLRAPDDNLELVLLIDSSARNLGAEFKEIEQFVQSLPAHTKIAIGYMENGRAALAGPLSADRAQVLRGLHLPSGQSSASPYFCLSDLAKHWPSADRAARHEVLLITDGVDPYNPRYDPEDTYVQSAIADSVRAGLVVYSIFWDGQNGAGLSSSETANGGQSLLVMVSQATGGKCYGMPTSSPVSLQPYLDDLARRLDNQYELSFSAHLDRKPAIESLKLKVNGFAAEIDAPQRVFVDRAGAAAE